MCPQNWHDGGGLLSAHCLLMPPLVLRAQSCAGVTWAPYFSELFLSLYFPVCLHNPCLLSCSSVSNFLSLYLINSQSWKKKEYLDLTPLDSKYQWPLLVLSLWKSVTYVSYFKAPSWLHLFWFLFLLLKLGLPELLGPTVLSGCFSECALHTQGLLVIQGSLTQDTTRGPLVRCTTFPQTNLV